MTSKLISLFATLVCATVLSGCNEGYNSNVTTNANTNSNANANTTVATSTPVPANTNTRRAPTREDYERDKDRYNQEAKQSGRTIGTGVNDGWLWVKTRFELAGVDDLRDSTINVDVSNAVVTLSGTVASAAQKTKAADTAKTVEGVKSVNNKLLVAADASAAPSPSATRRR